MPEIAGVMSGWISGMYQPTLSPCLVLHIHVYFCVDQILRIILNRVRFTVCFFTVGFVVLPAGAIKDAEGVGDCSQVFFVSECQDGAGGFRVRF
jgi:hypothetical protein